MKLPETRILIIDDDTHVLAAIQRTLQLAKFKVFTHSDPMEGLNAVAEIRPDVILLDVNMPVSGLELLKRFNQMGVDAEVIVMTGYGTIEMAVVAMKTGAFDFIGKPFEHPDTLILKIQRALERRQLIRRTRELENGALPTIPLVTGNSRQMEDIVRMVGRVAPTNGTVLITGETGVGKEMIARAVHRYSDRAGKPFLAVNCSALSEQLIESELFGHEKGSFTGAAGRRDGLFIEADGGTLLLDEIGEMPLPLQAKLLRVLQESEVRRVGGNRSEKVDVRLLAATNRDLAVEVAAGRFREDLFYRLNVLNIHIPPLRERRADLTALVGHFLNKLQEGIPSEKRKTLSPMALEFIESYSWPGNVRELENTIQRAIILSETQIIPPQALPASLLDRVELDHKPLSMRVDLGYQEAKQHFLDKFDRMYLASLLDKYEGNLSRSAEYAGMDRSNFRKLVLKAGLKGDLKREAQDEVAV